MAAKELLAQLHEVAANPRKQLDKYLAEGKKVVAVTYYTPQEIVHSMVPEFPPDGQPSPAYSARHLYKRPVSV